MTIIYPDFRINNNRIPDPTDSNWIIAETRGIDGIGQKRYTPYFSYQITYNNISPIDYYSGILAIWNGHYMSGTAVVKLPKYNGSDYVFSEYSGTIIDRPEIGKYNNNFISDVKITIRKIRVE